MLTIKNVLPNGHEHVVQVKQAVFQPGKEDKAQTSDEVDPVLYADLENGQTVPFRDGTVYVMNDNGRTVATYTLRYPEPDKKRRA